MSEFDAQLSAAIRYNADPKVVSPSGVSYARKPVWGWDHDARCHRWLWRERVIWFRPLGLLTEYSTYAGSEREFHNRHGRYSWQDPDVSEGSEAHQLDEGEHIDGTRMRISIRWLALVLPLSLAAWLLLGVTAFVLVAAVYLALDGLSALLGG